MQTSSWIGRAERRRRPRSWRPGVDVEGLDRRDLPSGAGVVASGAMVYVTPAPTGPNTTIVSYQMQNETRMLDVNLNGADHFYNASQITSLEYLGNGATGSQTFEDHTSLTVTAIGGSGPNHFVGGAGHDTLIGGSGPNTFDAGTGFDVLEGGFGTNVFNLNAEGSGIIEEYGFSNKINCPPGAYGRYCVIHR